MHIERSSVCATLSACDALRIDEVESRKGNFPASDKHDGRRRMGRRRRLGRLDMSADGGTMEETPIKGATSSLHQSYARLVLMEATRVLRRLLPAGMCGSEISRRK